MGKGKMGVKKKRKNPSIDQGNAREKAKTTKQFKLSEGNYRKKQVGTGALKISRLARNE